MLVGLALAVAAQGKGKEKGLSLSLPLSHYHHLLLPRVGDVEARRRLHAADVLRHVEAVKRLARELL